MTDEEIIAETWREFGRHFPYASRDRERDEPALPEGALTPSMLVRELERRSGRAGWHVVLDISTGVMNITPPGGLN